MNRRQVRSYQVLSRLAHVKQSRAALALATAIAEENEAIAEVDRLSDSFGRVSDARDRCLSGDPGAAIKDYALLSGLSEALHERRENARGLQLDAQAQRIVKGESAGQTQRFAQSVDEKLLTRQRDLAAEVETRSVGEALALWMQVREDAS